MQSESNQHSAHVETLEAFLAKDSSFGRPYQYEAADALAGLVEQLQAATSEDFSLVPKDEYARLKGIEEQYEGWVKLSHQLFNMIPREIWRDQGGDDGQGHYEGEYHAEQIEQEIHAALASFPAKKPTQ